MSPARKYWLVKSEPAAYSWENLVADGRTSWDGVRNHQARNNLQAMAPGDLVLFYHSVTDKQIVGAARAVSTAYPDPTAPDGPWVAVDLEPAFPLIRPVSLKAIKADGLLQGMALVTQARLSVMPVMPEQFDRVVNLGGRGRLAGT